MSALVELAPGRISLCGEVTLEGAPALRGELLGLLEGVAPDRNEWVFELDSVTSIDSAGAQLLVSFARSHDGRTRMAKCPPEISEWLERGGWTMAPFAQEEDGKS